MDTVGAMNADRIVSFVVIGTAATLATLSVGIEIGRAQESERQKTTCARQQDEKELLSTTVLPNGWLLCTYSMNGYGASKRTRKAE